MEIKYKNIIIKEASVLDIPLLINWWSDGKIMEHAGFPYGINETEENILKTWKENPRKYRYIIKYNEIAIGELCYEIIQENIADIGIKICDTDYQNRGLGKIILSMLIEYLFNEVKLSKIILDTLLENKRAQHVYEQLGFKMTGIDKYCWEEQTGKLRTVVSYELIPSNFIYYKR